MHVHIVGVCGTGMGSLAGLFRAAGHEVSGSDVAFYPPMGDALVRMGVTTRQGYDPSHLEPPPDLVVIGNVCRADNVEARAAIDRGLRYISFPAAMETMFLAARRGFVIAGTHGKTTTTALTAYLLDAAATSPGFLIGGIPCNFDTSFALGRERAPFVIEGDEYDSAFFEKQPKFWRYQPEVAVLTSLEHDHIDIYADMAAYRAAFEGFVARMPTHGALVAYAGDAEVRRVAAQAPCPVHWYAVEGDDCGTITPAWLAAPAPTQGEVLPFDLFIGGSACGRLFSPLAGRHNLRNVLAALAMCAVGAAVPLDRLRGALPGFLGVRRRQELRGVARGVRVYDDFAHHPSAVAETLAGLRERHPQGRLIAVFEPRSATASRRVHQDAYPSAFQPADLTLFAPVGRPEIAAAERLDVGAVVRAIMAKGGEAWTLDGVDAIVAKVAETAVAGDTVVVMSNGAFGSIHDKLLAALTTRGLQA